MKNKLILSLAAAVVAIGIGTISASAAQGWLAKKNFNRPQFDKEQMAEMQVKHQAVQEAIEKNDYQAFVEATKDQKFGPEVTEENFIKMAEMHNLIKSGDVEGAQALREELGLNQGFRSHGFHEMKDANGDGVCNQLDKQE